MRGIYTFQLFAQSCTLAVFALPQLRSSRFVVHLRHLCKSSEPPSSHVFQLRGNYDYHSALHYWHRSLAHFGDHFAPSVHRRSSQPWTRANPGQFGVAACDWLVPLFSLQPCSPSLISPSLTNINHTRNTNICNFPFHTAETSAKESAVRRHECDEKNYSVLT